MNDWSCLTIADVSLGVYDGPHATPKKTDVGPVFLGIWNLVDGRIDLSKTDHLSDESFAKWTRRITPQFGDVVFSYETRLGEAGLIPKGLRCCLGRRMALIRPDRTAIEPRFLLYTFLGPAFQEEIRARTVHGSTVDRIPLLEFPRFPLLVPPLDEQRAIASVLGSLDDKIELNRRMNRTLEQMAAAIFREHWERASTAEVAVPIAELERRAILLIGDGYRAKRSELADSGPPFIRAGNVKGRVDPSSAERLSVESAERAGVKNSQLWDSVFTTKGTVGRLGLVTRSTGDVVYAPQVCFWRSQSDKALHPLVLHEWMKSVLFTRQWEAVKGQTDMADFVSLTDQRSMTMDLLEPGDQHELGQKLQPLYDLIDSNTAENQALSDTRDALLPKLLSGEVRVSSNADDSATSVPQQEDAACV